MNAYHSDWLSLLGRCVHLITGDRQDRSSDRTADRTRAMPIGNLTGMTDTKRNQILDWIQHGAPR